MRSSTLVICILVLGSALSAELDLSTSLLSMDLSDIALLDTTSMSCATPQNEFERVSAQMAAWADIVQHKDSLHRDIDRLESIKQLIQKRKFKAIEKQIDKLELPKTESKIGEPILAEFKQKLKGLSNPQTADECEATMLKLCIYLLKQFNSCRQQCQSNPVTVIKIKGKIKDLQVVQQGCGQPAPCEDEPGVPDEPTPEEKTPSSEPEENPLPPTEEEHPPVSPPSEEDKPQIPDEKGPEEESVPPEEQQIPPSPPTPDEEQPEIPDEKGPEEKSIPDEEEQEVPSPPPGEEEEEKPEIPDEKGPEEKSIPAEEEQEVPTPPGEEEEEKPEIPNEESPEELSQPTEELNPEEEGSPEIPDEPPVNPNREESAEEQEEYYEEVEEEFEEFEEPPIILPPIEPPVEIVEKRCLNSVNENVYTSSVNEEIPLINKQLEGDDLSCYGFGFYTRWLQAYPTYLINGRQDEKYFIARISESEKLSGSVTDDSLSVFLTRSGFEFQSYDNEGTTSTVINVGDIEGQWIYIYYSYCNGKAVAVVNENGQTSVNEINVNHKTPQQLYFTLAGMSGDVKSFQGQFRLVQSNVGSNVFIETPAEANQFVFECNQLPEEKCERQISNLHEFEFNSQTTQFDSKQVVENSEPIFAQEYSISGWFKWHTIQEQTTNSWFSAFRLTMNNPAVNKNAKLLGDRDLALFVGNEKKDSVLAFTTYTYEDLYGNGNPTYWQAVPYEKDLVHWHFIYFGFNRHISKAYGYVEFLTRKGEVHFENVKHFISPHKYLYVGQDQYYPSYNGKIFNLHFNLCDGSYRELKYDEHWGYTPKPTDPVPPPPPQVPEEPSEEEYTEPPLPAIPSEPSEEDVPIEPEEETPVIPSEPPKSEEETPVEPSVSEEETPEVIDEPLPEPDEESVPESEEETEYYEEELYEEESVEPESQPEEEHSEPVSEEESQPASEEEEVTEPPGPLPQPKCPPTIEVNKDNAADILCELSHYLGEFAQGHTPVAGPSTKTVCFCMTYNEDYAPPTLLQLATKVSGRLQLNEPKVAVPLLKQFIKQRL
ncbi:unnamed protein product [Paramecium pentaurelia]|uniref:Uncharacterized protein n=1 Tax=Paramecium pentaurelia TaxID=43138 RepID=A0A8S1WX01_9CILI|nr:unnamed protein product [Paramecium pentaurelia]